MPFHEAGIEVIVVGIGSGVKPAELKSVVKSKSNLYFAKDFDQLKSKTFIKDIIDLSCNVSSKPSFFNLFHIPLGYFKR